MAGALAGIRVLDLSDSMAGQFCARMLADYGAEVLLVEPLGGCAIRLAVAAWARLQDKHAAAALLRSVRAAATHDEGMGCAAIIWRRGSGSQK